MDFRRLKVAKIERETKDAVVITLALPIFIASQFKYKAGQYVTIRVDIDGELHRRSYSLCEDWKSNKTLRIAVKKVPQGTVSSHMVDRLKEGDQLEVSLPMGRFTFEPDPSLARKFVFFAAGSGITPIMAHIEHILENEPRSSMVLFYGNREYDSIIFKERLDELQHQFGERFTVFHFLSRREHPGMLKGRINLETAEFLIRKHLEHPALGIYFVCGPEDLIDQTRKHFYKLNIPRAHVLYEYFEITKTPVTPAEKLNYMGDTKAKIILNGEETELNIPSGTKILDAVIGAGLDAPYSCQSGICTTCMAKAEGDFDTSANIALGEKDFEQGYILTCSTLCNGPEAVVNYDEV